MLAKEVVKTFNDSDLANEFTHMIEADVSVITRYTLYRNTIENQIKK